MTRVDGAVLNGAREPEVQAALLAVRQALASADCVITPSTETQVQNSLHALRSTSPYSDAVASLEAVATKLRVIAEAKRSGRCNLYMSQVIRLRKQVLA